MTVSEEFMEHCSEGALSIEVYGHRSAGLESEARLAERNQLAKSLADRFVLDPIVSFNSICTLDVAQYAFGFSFRCSKTYFVTIDAALLIRFPLEMWLKLASQTEVNKY